MREISPSMRAYDWVVLLPNTASRKSTLSIGSMCASSQMSSRWFFASSNDAANACTLSSSSPPPVKAEGIHGDQLSSRSLSCSVAKSTMPLTITLSPSPYTCGEVREGDICRATTSSFLPALRLADPALSLPFSFCFSLDAEFGRPSATDPAWPYALYVSAISAFARIEAEEEGRLLPDGGRGEGWLRPELGRADDGAFFFGGERRAELGMTRGKPLKSPGWNAARRS
mmetsp:Transcript_35725/g.93117  ORF Transcript_35725/g.93117 Transcript_35725/m.93117 type:complete len:228 (-) Transcript_35725:411-1094(-)